SVAVRSACVALGGSVLVGLSRMGLDGSTLEVADTPANVRAFGRPGSGRGVAAFPQLRAVAVIETGTHVLCDVVLRPSRCGEVPAALRLLRSVGPGMLLLWDRNFHSFEMVRATLARQAHFLGRTKVNIVLKPSSCRMGPSWHVPIRRPRRAAATATGSRCE